MYLNWTTSDLSFSSPNVIHNICYHFHLEFLSQFSYLQQNLLAEVEPGGHLEGLGPFKVHQGSFQVGYWGKFILRKSSNVLVQLPGRRRSHHPQRCSVWRCGTEDVGNAHSGVGWRWTWWSQRIFSSLNESVILWYLKADSRRKKG